MHKLYTHADFELLHFGITDDCVSFHKKGEVVKDNGLRVAPYIIKYHHDKEELCQEIEAMVAVDVLSSLYAIGDVE